MNNRVFRYPLAGRSSAVSERVIMTKFQKFGLGLVALSPLSAFAAIDVTAATTGVSDAQVAVLAVLGAMITFAAARYGLKKVIGLLGR